MYFFQYGAERTFSTFDLVHIIVLVLAIVGMVVLFLKRDKIYNYSKAEKLGMILGGFLLFLDVSFYIWKWQAGVQTHFPIPMHLCSWATYIVVASMFFRKEWLWYFALFYGFIGGLLSLLVPEFGGYSFDHMRFYQFFLLHFLILALPIYQYFIYRYNIKKKMMFVVLGFMYVQGIIAYLVNIYLARFTEPGDPHPNMMFVIEPPIPLPIESPWYLFLFGLLFLGLWYGLIKLLELPRFKEIQE